MSTINPTQLGKAITKHRLRLGISATELANRCQSSPSTITRLEAGEFATVRIDNLKDIARALNVPFTQLLSESKIIDSGDLPNLTPYLRTKYKHLPADAIREIEQHFMQVAIKHRITDYSGPAPGADE